MRRPLASQAFAGPDLATVYGKPREGVFPLEPSEVALLENLQQTGMETCKRIASRWRQQIGPQGGAAGDALEMVLVRAQGAHEHNSEKDSAKNNRAPRAKVRLQAVTFGKRA